jgi:ketosteroid isomerase-like protein
MLAVVAGYDRAGASPRQMISIARSSVTGAAGIVAAARMEGRDAIMSFVTAFWSTSPLRYERYRTIAIHRTADPDTIVVEQEVAGISSTTGPFVLPNVMVLTARHGRIAHVRDYASLPAVEAAAGSPVS